MEWRAGMRDYSHVVMTQTKPDFRICGVLQYMWFGGLGIQGVDE